MHLYALTLQRSTAITSAIYGSFSAPQQQEVVVARGEVLELLRPDDNGKLVSVHTVDVFGLVRSLQPFRLTGSNRDYIVVGSDSGRITVLEFRPTPPRFERVHLETFGKSGCRRIVPGEFLATDPRGRALLIGALEKQKLVYTMNRDSSAHLTISSPLEAHKAHTLCFDVVGLDVGFDNPVFAALEVDYEEVGTDPTGEPTDPDAGPAYEKVLTHYELDLGLNHVTRKWSGPVDPTANALIAVPGGDDGPGGVLVCSENFVVYRSPGQPERRCLLPRRKDMPADHGLLVVAHAVHRQKDLFFALIQTDAGDVFKVTLAHAGGAVSEVVVRYLDTIPVAVALVILKTGFLFAASEAGNHALYQFTGVGDDEDAPQASSRAYEGGDETVALVEPRPLQNLLLVDELESCAPVTAAHAADFAREGAMQVAALCGRGPRSTVRTLRHGLAVAEMAVSELPGNPNAVWTCRTAPTDAEDKYIIVSFVNATLVLSIGETVEEVTDSGLLGSAPTLAMQLLDGGSLCQVHPGGLRHVRPGRPATEWRTPNQRQIVKAAANARQVVVALQGGELIYFELDAMGALAEHDKKDLGQEVACLDLGAVPEGRQRCRFLVVGSWDNYVRILSLDPDDCMQVIGIRALPAPIESCALLDVRISDEPAPRLFLAIGLSNGVLMRTTLDPQTGDLAADTLTLYCGQRPVRCFKVLIGGKRGLLALSSRCWAGYAYHGRFHMTPLSYEALEHASSFCSEQCPEGIVAVAGNTLRIVAPERLGETFNQTALPLRYTPRRMALHPPSGLAVVVETDHRAYGEELKARVYAEATVDASKLVKAGEEPPEEAGEDGDEGAAPLTEANVGVPRAPDGRWASCVRVVDVGGRKSLCVRELPDNVAAFSVAAVPFRDMGGEFAIVVGACSGLELHPRSVSGGQIDVYRLLDNGRRLELVHSTPCEEMPYALADFGGRLLVGVGATLRLYDLGKKRLLRKCEARPLPTMIQSIQVVSNERIVVGDASESFHWVRYRAQDNALAVFADEPVSRHLTAACQLDYNTVAGADKFGNVFVLRLAPEAGGAADAAHMDGYLNGAPNKADLVAQYHVGEIVVSLQRVKLSAGGAECILFVTNMGAVGALLPIASKDDVDFFKHLEMHLRQEAPPLCGRDHMFYRSSFYPVKDTTDGDLCEQYSSLPTKTQAAIAEDLDRTPQEVAKKLEDIRNRIL